MADSVTSAEAALFRRRLLRWYSRHARTFPWRTTKSPFRLLLAEMMLQRTRAEQVVPVYETLVAEAGSPALLAHLRLPTLRRILKPLGLSWRVANFRDVAHALITKHGGRLPETRPELTALPGVGDYVAGIILAVGLRQREWVVDSNIVRVYRRYFGLKTSKEGRRDRWVIQTAKLYADSRKPREATLALLDFASLVCKPCKPECHGCPVKRDCASPRMV